MRGGSDRTVSGQQGRGEPRNPPEIAKVGPRGDWYGAPVPAWISLNRDGLALVGGPEAYSFPAGPRDATVRLSLVDAVRAPILPAVVAERVLAAWSRGEPLPEWAPEVDPRHERRRGAAVVLSGDHMLLIRYPPAVRDGYFIPGGSVEPGETPAVAAVRELKEETGLAGTVVRLIATVLNRTREEHYHLVSIADGEPTPLDLAPARRSSGCRSRTCRGCRSGRSGWPGGCRGGPSTAGPTHRRSSPTPSATCTPAATGDGGAATSGTAGGCRGR